VCIIYLYNPVKQLYAYVAEYLIIVYLDKYNLYDCERFLHVVWVN